MMTALRWSATIAAVLVLAQAALVGQALYLGDETKLALHGWLGSASFAAAVVVSVLALAAVRRGAASRLTLGIGLVVTLLMIAQLGLGYVGRRGGWPAAIHIPNGVLIAGLLFVLAATTLAPQAPAGRLRP